MKLTFSFVFQLPPLTFEDDVKAIARNLLGAFDFLLNLSSFRSSFFLDGTVLEAISHAAGPLSIGKIRHGIREGKLEFLGGSYHDSLLPLFPTELQQLQLKMHRKLLRKMFDVEPMGFFNSSMVWEMDMTDLLSRESFEYSLVSESALQDALGRTTPISGWFTTEDKGALMRVVPVAEGLSRAIAEDKLDWESCASLYCRENKSAVVMLTMPRDPKEIVPFFERLAEFVEMNEIRTWPVGHIVSQQGSEGSVSSLMSVGTNLGLPATAKSCRELLIRRPEINMLHKTILALYRSGVAQLDVKDQQDFFRRLLPAMLPQYFRDLQEGGMRSPAVRWRAYRHLISVVNWLGRATGFDGLRVEVSDFLLVGRKLVSVENPHFSLLLDYAQGGTLRSLNYKRSTLSLLSAWRDDGEPTLGFLDCLIPNTALMPAKLDQILSNRENLLAEAYDYQIKRHEESTDIQLSSEQAFAVGSRRGLVQIEKRYSLGPSKSAFQLTYRVSNSTYVDFKGYFGTLMELGMRPFSARSQAVYINGQNLHWKLDIPFIFPDATSVEIYDRVLSCLFRLDFDVPTNLFLGPIFGASSTAAPESFQGIRIFPFWKLAMESLNTANYGIKVSLSQRKILG